ncbi:MAG: alpha/beta hydrolase [Pseudomonadota bacterium]
MSQEPTEVRFRVDGEALAGWWFEPQMPARSPCPCIVMAHGLGGTRNAGLVPYARTFAEAGFAVLLFDYRHFGASEGEPRQLVSVRRQLADWQGAIDFARHQTGIDPRRIALWGSSFSGGHVIVAAARDGGVAAVSAQGPMMDGLAAVMNVVEYAGIGGILRLSGLALRDQARALVGGAPLYAPIVGHPGETAAMATEDAYDGYRAIAPADWRNELAARLALQLPLYRPLRYARRVPCPVLILVCGRDSVAPPEAAEKVASRAGGRAELHRYDDLGHFDIYVGEGFQRSSSDQLAFFQRHLLS